MFGGRQATQLMVRRPNNSAAVRTDKTHFSQVRRHTASNGEPPLAFRKINADLGRQTRSSSLGLAFISPKEAPTALFLD